MKIIVEKDGNIRFMYSDDFCDLMDEGKYKVCRVSHVEPCDGGWSADLTPINGPILGPYKKRKDALDAEIEWINENNIPVCL